MRALVGGVSCLADGGATMTKWTEADERRLTFLEQQVGALLVGRERMSMRIMTLREFIARNCEHSTLNTDCPTCQFLQEDAK